MIVCGIEQISLSLSSLSSVAQKTRAQQTHKEEAKEEEEDLFSKSSSSSFTSSSSSSSLSFVRDFLILGYQIERYFLGVSLSLSFFFGLGFRES